MTNQPWPKLLLACVGCLAAVSPASAQHGPWGPEEPPHGSHRPIDTGIGDLNGAESLLALRLHRTQNAQEMAAIQDLVKQGLADPAVVAMLKDKLKGVKPDDLDKLEDVLKKNPELLDDPKLHDMLKEVEKFKQGGVADLPEETKKDLAKWAKDFIDDHKQDLAGTGPTQSRPLDPSAPPDPPRPPPPQFPKSQPDFAPSGGPENPLGRELLRGMAGFLKDVDRSPEGEALRTAALRELANMDKHSPGAASDLANFLKGWITPEDASWLARNLKPPSMPGLGGWSPGPSVSAGPSFGGSSDGLLDGAAWVAVLALLAAAAWTAYTMARRHAAAARAKPWSPGPWPVAPSQVSTREDLIRAFEHLVYLLLGPTARSLNHLDAADRIGAEGADHAGAAARLARLYEQARYAPPDEPLPADELTAARGDLTALAGAAA